MALPAVDERLPGRVRAARTARIITRINCQLARLDHGNSRAWMAVPAGGPARCDHDLLNNCLLRIADVNNLVVVSILDLEFDLDRVNEVRPRHNRRAQYPGARSRERHTRQDRSDCDRDRQDGQPLPRHGRLNS